MECDGYINVNPGLAKLPPSPHNHILYFTHTVIYTMDKIEQLLCACLCCVAFGADPVIARLQLISEL